MLVILLVMTGLSGMAVDRVAPLPAEPPAAQRLQGFWERALQEEYCTPEALHAQDAREQRKGLRYRKILRGHRRIPAVALTFDNGPHPEYTAQILAILRKYDVRATWFVVGEQAEQYPELVRAMAQAGHVVGNHTYHHVNLTSIPSGEIANEWCLCNQSITRILGSPPRYCRPPGGAYDVLSMAAAASAGLTTVLWTDDPGDFLTPGALQVEETVLGQIDAGSIVLLRDGSWRTVQLLPSLIEHLQRRGLLCYTLEEFDRDLRMPFSPYDRSLDQLHFCDHLLQPFDVIASRAS
jgi:peptidoglycan/xylan/chitin deacetylase (PgdA/CDA1 family)